MTRKQKTAVPAAAPQQSDSMQEGVSQAIATRRTAVEAGQGRTIPLSDQWRIHGAAPQADDPKHLSVPAGSVEWIPCPVPGDVHAALVQAGKIPNPHFGTNGRQCYWVSGMDWWYRREFDLDKAWTLATLILTGVNGPAELWLNGKRLGEMHNSFREFRFDVTDKLKPRGNVLLLRFKSIDACIGPRVHELKGWTTRTFLRMPAFSFGWDWALPLPAIGLGGQVALELDRPCRMVDVAVQPFTSGRVDFSFEVTPEAKAAGYRIDVSVRGHGASVRRSTSRNVHRSYVSCMIPHPKLWWPNGYGDQPLYDYTVSLVVGGKVVDQRRGKLGLREVRMVERPFSAEAGPGMTMALEVNGVEIFCKGGNMAPMEIWPATARPEQYDFYLRKAAEANFNMLRTWGGGIYEPECLYELCDELGILVWQDFMFASHHYPYHALQDEIFAEAHYQLRRLRNHPCLAIWCGCNEDVHSWSFRSEIDPRPEQASTTGKGPWQIEPLREDPPLYALLRGMVARLGLGVPFVQTSPASRDDCGNMPNSGNCHISAWKFALFETDNHPERFRKHFEAVCSFNSEFCIQGPCNVAAFRRFMPEDKLWPPNEDWVYHIQRGHGNLPHYEQTLMIAGAVFGEIDSLQKYVKHGQATHVEMMRAEFESARRDRPNNGGTMVWQYNDCWPTSNWSIIDYYRSPKPSYYSARRACAPLLPIIFERGGQIEFFFGNDTQRPARVTVAYGQETLGGKRVWTKRKTLRADANGTVRFDRVPRNRWKGAPGDYLFIDAVADGVPMNRITYFPDMWKDVPWPHPNVAVQKVSQRREKGLYALTVRLTTDQYARLCHLRLRKFDPTVSFSDNFFDLCAGGSREIVIRSPRKVSTDDLLIGHWWTEWE